MTQELARQIGQLCRGGELILLLGDLGAGKTCFTQGLALGLGIPATTHVTSPTFTLHGEYEGRLILNHLDLYRLENSLALEGLGLEDMLLDKGAVTVVEWPAIAEAFFGARRLDVHLQSLGQTERSITLTARHPESAYLLAAARMAQEQA